MKSGYCLWCHHPKGVHTGQVDPDVKRRLEGHRIRWTTTACSKNGCACRTYETAGRSAT